MGGNGIVVLTLNRMRGGKIPDMIRYVSAPVDLPVLILSASCTNPSNVVQ